MASIVNDDDTITVGELRTAMRERAMTFYTADKITDEIAEWVFAHREPEYPEGTVVKDASGKFWRRLHAPGAPSSWETFGTGFKFGDKSPARPLTVIP